MFPCRHYGLWAADEKRPRWNAIASPLALRLAVHSRTEGTDVRRQATIRHFSDIQTVLS